MIKKSLALIVSAGICITLIAGCRNSQDEMEKKLYVTADSQHRNEITQAVNYFERENPDWTVVMHILPIDQQERESEIQKMKTEAMTGEGPDVYLLNASNPGLSVEEDGKAVFSSVGKTMESGAFYCLNEYMEADSYWKTNPCHPQILKAGQLRGKQYVLPLGCEYMIYYYPETEQPIQGNTLAQWSVQMDSPEYEGRKENFLRNVFWKFGHRWIQPAVDYETRVSCFDGELTAEWINTWFPEFLENPLGTFAEELWGITEMPENVPEGSACQAVPDLLGHKTAGITVYGAVGQGSENPEEAYDFLMLFLDDRMEKAQVTGTAGYLPSTYCPVQERGLKNLLKQSGKEDITEAVLESFRELDAAYFPGETERNMNEEFYNITNYSDTSTEEERTAQVTAFVNKYAKAYEILAKE